MAKKSPTTPKAARKDPAASKAAFDALVSEKIAAGLSRSDAEFVAKQQLAHDAALAGDASEEEGRDGDAGDGQKSGENPPAQ